MLLMEVMQQLGVQVALDIVVSPLRGIHFVKLKLIREYVKIPGVRTQTTVYFREVSTPLCLF